MGLISNETTKTMSAMTTEGRKARPIPACEIIKKKHYGLQIFEILKFEDKEIFLYIKQIH